MGISPIKLSEAIALVNYYQEPHETLEQILDIEQIIFPSLLKTNENDDDTN